MLTLQSLGDDILINDLGRNLDLQDVISMSSALKYFRGLLYSDEVFKFLYRRRYHAKLPNILQAQGWLSAFKFRSSKKIGLFTWGSPGNGRLGYKLSEVPPTSKSHGGVHTPMLVAAFNEGSIDQLEAGGFSFQVLINGTVLCVGARYTNGLDMVQNPDRRPSLGRSSGALTFGHHNSRMSQFESNFVTEMYCWSNDLPAKITAISSGRQSFLGLDDIGKVFAWDSGNADWRTGVQLDFMGYPGAIIKIRCGWDISACEIGNVGCLVWAGREAVDNPRSFSKVYGRLIPHLKSAIDFITLESCVLIINFQGLIELYWYHTDETREEKEINDWIRQANFVSASMRSFARIRGRYRTFYLITSENEVISGCIGPGQCLTFDIDEELQLRNIQDIYVGDYHALGLTAAGQLLSWGRELQIRGCLGQGPPKADENLANAMESRSRISKTPASVVNPERDGLWLLGAAAGWHSGGLFGVNLPEF